VYYVIDAARPTTSGAPQGATPIVGGEATVPAGEAQVSIVVISASNADGDVIHEVLAGQTLWQIAISYNVKIEEIKRLNNLASDDIYPGEKLLISKGVSETDITTATPTSTKALQPASTSTIVPTSTLIGVTYTPTPTDKPSMNNLTTMVIMIGIIALAILGGGLFTRFGASRNIGGGRG